jgi:hypothetical protein
MSCTPLPTEVDDSPPPVKGVEVSDGDDEPHELHSASESEDSDYSDSEWDDDVFVSDHEQSDTDADSPATPERRVAGGVSSQGDPIKTPSPQSQRAVELEFQTPSPQSQRRDKTGSRPTLLKPTLSSYDEKKWHVEVSSKGMCTLKLRKQKRTYTIPVTRANKALTILDPDVLASDLANADSKVCKCTRECFRRFTQQQLERHRYQLLAESSNEREALVWLAGRLEQGHRDRRGQLQVKYVVDGVAVCPGFWALVYRISQNKLFHTREVILRLIGSHMSAFVIVSTPVHTSPLHMFVRCGEVVAK